MISVRTLAGIVLSIIGMLLFVYAGLNFNNLFFVQKLMTKNDIPVYSPSTVVPAFLGLLILLDGSFVLGLKRVFSLSAQIIGNFVWLLALFQLNQNLMAPITDVSAYQQVFVIVFVGVLFFMVGIIVNDIPQHRN